jgi:hypothetical protein
LYYGFVDEEKLYMNFCVKLILGIKNDGRHVQYSVNKIDVVKKIKKALGKKASFRRHRQSANFYLFVKVIYFLEPAKYF